MKWGRKKRFLYVWAALPGVFVLSSLLFFLTACGGNCPKTYSEEERKELDSIVNANSSTDSLKILAERFA